MDKNLNKQEIHATREEIDELLVEDPEKALTKIKILNNKYRYTADFYLGLAYFSGFGVEIDKDEARKRFLNAVSLHDDLEGDALLFLGYLYQDIDIEKALDYFVKAENLGCKDAIEQTADCLFTIAMELRNAACKTLKMNEYTTYNSSAIEYAIASISQFFLIAEDNEMDMEIGSWCCFGRAAQFLYNVACRGEFTTEIKTDNTITSYISSGFNTFMQKTDTSLHQKYWDCLVAVCAAMDNNGYELIGEYFRALGGLLDAKLNKSAEAFYRVRWHMKRIGELRKSVSLDNSVEIHQTLSDIDDEFEKMGKKYGAITDGMLRKGEYPYLQPSYPNGKAPTVESCQNFMEMLNHYKSLPFTPTQVSNNKQRSGLFGLFRK